LVEFVSRVEQMRNRVIEYRGRLLSHAAVAAVLAGTAAGCSADATRFHDPLFTGSTANQRQIISSGQPMPPAIASSDGAVARSDLPPPAGAVASGGVISGPPAAPPAQPVLAKGGSYGWSATGGEVITVGPGQSLETLSIKYGVPVAEIGKANQIHSPADVHTGKVLVIPVRVALAPPAAPPAAPVHIAKVMPAAAAASPVAKVRAGDTIHVVETGQTLYSIARQYGARVDDVIALNDLKPGQGIRVGEKLRIPAGGAPTAAVQAVAYAPEKPSQALGAPPKALGKLIIKNGKTVGATPGGPAADAAPAKPAAPAIPAAPPQPVVADVPKIAPAAAAAPVGPAVAPVQPASLSVDAGVDPPSANGTSFRWPVRGRIISAFGSKPNGEKNDGINLAVPEGTSVKAAEAGTVIYSGNELAGYGNLILIRHADGWVTAYAHNSDLVVKRGDQVRRGQIIAHAGMTGSVTAPQVHFELRRGAKPVNPLDYLVAGA
jgi:murein DD-endopeptidase MepM/ murein hydrolase activator NlpD